jgi:hypothetical protein
MRIDLESPERPYVILGPMPTEDEWAEINRNDYGIRLLSFNQPLDSLLPYAERFDHLNVIAGASTNLEPVAQMTRLKTLFLAGAVSQSLDLSALTRISTFGADHAHRVTGVLTQPSLRRLFLTWGSHKWSPIAAPIEQLTVRSAQRLERLPDLNLQHPEALEELTIYDARSLSLSDVGDFVNLRKLSFTSSRLSGVDAVRELSRLEDLYLEDCPVLEPSQSLHQLRNMRVTVVGKHPFDLEFIERTLQDQLPASWTFPPRDVNRIKKHVRKTGAGPVDH